MAHETRAGQRRARRDATRRDATRRDATREEESARTSSLLFPFGGAEGFGLPKAAGRVSDEDRGARGWNAAAMATIEARRMRILLLTASPQDLLEPSRATFFVKSTTIAVAKLCQKAACVRNAQSARAYAPAMLTEGRVVG